MIYIVVNEDQRDVSNRWVKDNLDPGAGDSFIVNRVGKCLISLVDDGSFYTKSMKEHFGFVSTKPVLIDLPL